MGTDVNVARPAPKRPRREDVVYSTPERARSPLILVEWAKVVMDEVQMVGGGKVEYVNFFPLEIVYNRFLPFRDMVSLSSYPFLL